MHLKESLYMPEFESVAEKPNSFPDVSPAMFSGASFYLDTTFASYNTLRQMWGEKVGTEKNLIKSKIAQLRVYPTSLSEEQLLYIQVSSSCKLTLAVLVSNMACFSSDDPKDLSLYKHRRPLPGAKQIKIPRSSTR